MAIDAIIVHDMKINEYSVHFSVYFQRVTPSEKVEIVSTLYFNTALDYILVFFEAFRFCKRQDNPAPCMGESRPLMQHHNPQEEVEVWKSGN